MVYVNQYQRDGYERIFWRGCRLLVESVFFLLWRCFLDVFVERYFGDSRVFLAGKGVRHLRGKLLELGGGGGGGSFQRGEEIWLGKGGYLDRS